MKKRSVALLTALVLLLSFVLTSCGSALFPYNVYRLSPDVFGTLFSGDITPQDFVETEGEETWLYQNYVYAKVDKDGYLILVLTNEQRDGWKNSDFTLRVLATIWEGHKDIGVAPIDWENEWGEDPDDPIKNLQRTVLEEAVACGLKMSDDYRQIVGEPGDDTFCYPWFIHMGVFMQLLEGVPSDEIYVEYIEYDEYGREIDRVIWPDDADESGIITNTQ